MATALHDAHARVAPPSHREPWWSRLLRAVGWLLIGAGVVVALFIVYLLWWTDRETAVAQADLIEDYTTEFVLPDAATATSPDIRDLANIPVEPEPLAATEPGDGEVDDQGQPLAVPTDTGDAYALIWFQRGDEFIITDGPIGAIEGVTLDDLRRGPGHYPFAEAPGQPGNAAFAGHRTTYGRPFHNIDQLRAGDEIHVLDDAGRHWIYDFLELEIVRPDDVWVVEDDAVPGISHLLTFTSCHPKFSARERIVAFAELRGASDLPPDATDGDDDAAASEASELPAEDATAASPAHPRAGSVPPRPRQGA